MMEVVTIGKSFPCCGHQARFREGDETTITVERQCHKCGTEWTVTRKVGTPTRRATVRIDELVWHERVQE